MGRSVEFAEVRDVRRIRWIGARRARPGPAADDRLVGLAGGDRARRGLARPRPVLALARGERTVGGDVVAAGTELGDERLRDARALVRGDRDPHGRESRRAARRAACGRVWSGPWTPSRSSRWCRARAKLAAALPQGSRGPLRAMDDRAMEFASQDAELRAALFRFVDVVPACRSLDDLARHLTGYLDEVDERPPPIDAAMQMGVQRAGPGRAGRRRRCAVSGTWRTASSSGDAPRRPRRAARPVDAAPPRSVDLLGEATVTRRGRPLRGPCTDGARDLAGVYAPLAPAPAARGGRASGRAAREPVGEGLGAHAAAATGCAGARPRGCGARGCGPARRARDAGRPPAHRHGVVDSARRPSDRVRRARRGGVPEGPSSGLVAPGVPEGVAAAADQMVDWAGGTKARARSSSGSWIVANLRLIALLAAKRGLPWILSFSELRECWRSYELWARRTGTGATGCDLRGQDTQGRESRRPAD